jgi:hypothetical protein
MENQTNGGDLHIILLHNLKGIVNTRSDFTDKEKQTLTPILNMSLGYEQLLFLEYIIMSDLDENLKKLQLERYHTEPSKHKSVEVDMTKLKTNIKEDGTVTTNQNADGKALGTLKNTESDAVKQIQYANLLADCVYEENQMAYNTNNRSKFIDSDFVNSYFEKPEIVAKLGGPEKVDKIKKCASSKQGSLDNLKNIYTYSKPKIIEMLINEGIKFKAVLKEIVEIDETTVSSETNAFDIIQRNFDKYILKKDKEFGVYNEECEIDLSDERYSDKEGTVENLKLTKSPSLKNLGYMDKCPPFHRKKIKQGSEEGTTVGKRGCCILDPKSKVKAAAINQLTAAKSINPHWSSEDMRQYVQTYNIKLHEEEKQVHNEIKIIESKIGSEQNKDVLWNLEHELSGLREDLESIRKTPIKKEKTEMVAWEKAEAEFNQWKGQLGDEYNGVFQYYLKTIISTIEIYIYKNFYDDDLDDSSSLLNRITKNISFRGIKNQLINGLILIIKHPKMAIAVGKLLNHLKKKVCAKLSKSLNMRQLRTEADMSSLQTLRRDDYLNELVDTLYSMILIGTNGPGIESLSNKLWTGLSGLCITITPYLVPFIGCLQGLFSYCLSEACDLLMVKVWEKIYEKGFSEIFNFLDPTTCIKSIPMVNSIPDGYSLTTDTYQEVIIKWFKHANKRKPKISVRELWNNEIKNKEGNKYTQDQKDMIDKEISNFQTFANLRGTEESDVIERYMNKAKESLSYNSVSYAGKIKEKPELFVHPPQTYNSELQGYHLAPEWNINNPYCDNVKVSMDYRKRAASEYKVESDVSDAAKKECGITGGKKRRTIKADKKPIHKLSIKQKK